MAIDGMKVIDLDSHLVGDLESWDQTIEAKYKEFLPNKLPTKDNERRKTLVGNQIMVGSELGRHKAEKLEWVKPDDLTPQGRVRNMDLDGIDVAVCRRIRRRSTFSGSPTIPNSPPPMPARRTIT